MGACLVVLRPYTCVAQMLLSVCLVLIATTGCGKENSAVDVESTVLASVVIIESAEFAYSQTKKSPSAPEGTYATLEQLGEAGLIPARLVDGSDQGYTYHLELIEDGQSWVLVALDSSSKGSTYVAGKTLTTIYRCGPPKGGSSTHHAEITRILQVAKSGKLEAPEWTPAR